MCARGSLASHPPSSRPITAFARRERFSIAVALAFAGLAGCVDRGAGSNPGADLALVAKNLLHAVPAELTARIDAAFGGAGATAGRGSSGAAGSEAGDLGVTVIYLGSLVDREELIPGEAVKVRHFWRVVSPPVGDLRVFTHLRGDEGGFDFMNLDDSPMRRAHPPSSWRAGEIIQDEQSVTLRPDWHSKSATLLVGMARRGRHGAGDRLPILRGPASEGAVVARRFSVDLSKAPPPPGTVVVRKAISPIVVDGIGNEATWAAVPWSADFATAEGSRDPAGRAQAKLTWNEEHLYLLVHVEDSEVASPYRQRDEPLWKADCIEIFIDADRNRRQYVELQVNPLNAQFDSYFASTRAQPGDTSFDARMVSQVVVQGTADQSGDTDAGWDLELAIPWQAVHGLDPSMSVRLPPVPGDRFSLNVVRVDKRAGDKNPTASSWNRITYADFHALDRMLTVVFAEPPVVQPGGI
jgi:hypothetical protein